MKRLFLAALIAGAAFPGGVAVADHCLPTPTNPIPPPGCVAYDCDFNAVAQEDATGGQDTFTGAARGYVVGSPGQSVSVRCYITVDGVEASSTPTGSDTTVATTAGPVTFVAPDGSDVKVCGEFTGHTECWETVRTQVPPQEVIDVIEDVTGIPDFVICPVFASFAPGVPGAVEFRPDGDIYVAGEFFWDCPPYED